jgi:hypothetical protein
VTKLACSEHHRIHQPDGDAASIVHRVVRAEAHDVVVVLPDCSWVLCGASYERGKLEIDRT